MQDEINSIIAKGVAGNLPVYDIAKDLQKYVNPSAAKSWEWSKVYPNSRKKIDYNAQRLARTMVSHAYSQSVIDTAKNNPFIRKVEWRSAFAHGRTCDICADLDGQVFDPSDVPLDHPNGLCTLIPVVDDLDSVASRIGDWANGKEDKELDKFKNYLES